MDSKYIQNENVKEGLNPIRTKNIFENIKSKYILQKILDKFSKMKLLNIIKYNKKAQKRLDLSINDYMNYSLIIIEITPSKNKLGKFINIKNGEESYYKIYFNDRKEEIKRQYLKETDKVTKITIKIGYQVKSLSRLFLECKCIESIYLNKLYRENINDISYMFHLCTSLKEINISNSDTNNIINMSNIFNGCISLISLDLSNFNFNKVKNIICSLDVNL